MATSQTNARLAGVPIQPPGGRRRASSVVIWAATLGVSVACLAGYLFAYPHHTVRPVGFDMEAYVWQAKAVGHGPLSVIGARPGLPVLAALLGAAVRVETPREVVVLMPVLALLLALAAAAAVRMAFGLPGWTVPVVAAVAALYPGTARVVHGYQASLLVMSIVTAGAVVLVHSRGRGASLGVAAGLFAAACLSNIALFGLFAGIVAIYVLASMPAHVRDRGEGRPFLATDAAAASAVLVGGALGAAAIYGWVGARLGSTIDIMNVIPILHRRTLLEIRRIRPYLTLPLAAIGAAWLRVARRTTSAGPLVRLGAAWLAVTAIGTLAGVITDRVPGHRFLLFSVPVPALAGVGVAGMGWLVGRRAWWPARVAGVVLAAVLVAPIARAGLEYFRANARLDPRLARIEDDLRGAAAYVQAHGEDRPVVFVLHRPGPLGAYSTKFRSYLIRANMPAEAVPRTLVYPGTLDNLEAGRPTLLPRTERWQRDFDEISLEAWERVRPALGDGAIVLVLRRLAQAPFAAAMARDPSREVYPGVYVARGPAVPVPGVPLAEPFGSLPASLAAGALLAILAVVGWGFVRLALASGEATPLDVALLSPAVGAAVAVLAGFLLAAAGADPRGPWGIVTLLALGGTSLLLGLGIRGAESPSGA